MKHFLLHPFKLALSALLALSVSLGHEATAQCTLEMYANSGYTLHISINPVAIVAPESCPWGYNYNLVIEYDVSFSGNNLPNSGLHTLQGVIYCGNSEHFFDLPNQGGSGTLVTGSNVWRSQSDCGEMSPQLLECGQLALQINGPGLANQTVQCNVVLPEAPPTHPSLVCGNHVIVVDDNLDCSEHVEVATLNLAGIQGAFNPDHYYMVNDFNGTSNASGFYPPGVTWVTWELYYEPTDELVSTCVQTVEVVLGDLFMICDNQFNDHTWKGFVSDDWNDGANWADGSVPPEKANVTIDTENYNPLIDATYVVNNILIKEGSAMNFAYPTSTLRVSGDFVNNGNFAPAQGRVTFDGIGNRLVKGNNVPVFHGLRLDVQDTLLLLTSINFTGALQPLKGVFNWNNYKVTLTSDVVNTGSIGEIKPEAEILGDSILYHRFVPTGPGRWRMFCSPLTDATFEQWNDDFPTTGFPGSNFPNHPNAANPWASIRSYDETITGNDMHSGFQPLAHITDLIENGAGYFVYFVPNSTLIDMEGTFKRGSRHWNLDHTDSNDDPYQDGWNLLGNPYPSAIDWDSPTGWTKENIAAAVYAYDPVNGQYSTYINGISVGELDGKIASFQAFWVKAEGPNASISINETAKISENGVFMKSNNMQMHDLIRVRLSTASENVFDETVFGFHLNASNEFDSDLDAYKLFATNANLPNIATRLGEERPMGISMLPLPDDDLIIDLYVRPGHYTSFTLTNTLVDSFDDEVCIVLEDAELQTMVAFNQGDAYAFTPGEMDLTQRFKLRVSAPLDVTVFNESCPDSDNGRAIVQGFGAAPWTFTWHDEMGSVLRVTSESSVADVFDDLTPGFYEVMVENSGDHCTSITKLIHVQAAPQAFATAKMSTRSTCNDQPTGVLSLETDEVYNWAITAVPDGDFPTIQFSALPSDTVLTGFFGTPYLITAQNGCGANATLGIYNFSDPMAVEAGITVSSNQVTMLQQGGVVNFFSTSSAAASTLIWDFGDGSTTEGSAQPSHGYEQLGQYTVQLVASNSRCADTAQVVINVTNAGAGTSMAGGAQQQANSDLADKELPALTVTIFSERMRILAEQSIDQKVIVSIFNLTGQRVLHQEMGSLPSGQTEVDVSALNQGLYTYGLQTESTLLKSGEFFK